MHGMQKHVLAGVPFSICYASCKQRANALDAMQVKALKSNWYNTAEAVANMTMVRAPLPRAVVGTSSTKSASASNTRHARD